VRRMGSGRRERIWSRFHESVPIVIHIFILLPLLRFARLASKPEIFRLLFTFLITPTTEPQRLYFVVTTVSMQKVSLGTNMRFRGT
jgi:hypothetical protein